MTPTLHTARLVLRPRRAADRAPFAALNANPAVMAPLPTPLTRVESDALADRIAAHLADYGYGLWAVEVGWRLAHAHGRCGYATEAARAAVAYGFDEVGLDEIVSFTVPHNRPSRRVREKVGLLFAGEFEHPRLPAGHPLRRHMHYRLIAAQR